MFSILDSIQEYASFCFLLPWILTYCHTKREDMNGGGSGEDRIEM
jgi:hypothetical protein